MKGLLESLLHTWNASSPTRRRWIIFGGGLLLGLILCVAASIIF